MIWEIIKYLCLAAIIALAYYGTIAEMRKQYYQKQGVKFASFSTLYDGIAMIV